MERKNLEIIKNCVMDSIEKLAMESTNRNFIIDAAQARAVIADLLEYENFNNYINDDSLNCPKKMR